MKAKKQHKSSSNLFRPRLDLVIDMKHPLVELSKEIDWNKIDIKFGSRFRSHRGRPALSTRLMSSLMLMQHSLGISDEKVVSRWLSDPYWQYFSGMECFEHKVPIHPTSMVRWRKYIQEEGAEFLLSQLILTAKARGNLTTDECKRVNVDTTVQEKNITYPTDNKLNLTALLNLVKLSKKHNVELRQSYTRTAKSLSLMVGRYAHAKQYKRMKRAQSKLNNRLGRVIRDIKRKIADDVDTRKLFTRELELANKIYHQQKNDKNKIYSYHEPYVECISKGKAHKTYEFGNKVSIVSTNKNGWILSSKSFFNNPYDGHTFKAAITNAQDIANVSITHSFVDKGYRGCSYTGVQIFRSSQKKISRWFKKQLNRRSAIEAHISHMKNDGKLGRNYLKGKEGDRINAVLCAVGHNFRLLYARVAFLYKIYLRYFSKFITESTNFTPSLRAN